MATAAVETCQPLDFGVVGIHRNPSISDFKSSLDTYNSLPDDSEQPDVGPGTLKALAEIFVRHGAHKVYGLHLVHGHSQAPQGTVMVGTTFVEEGKNMCWTKPTPVSELDEDVHGHIYQLRDGAFIPYEYRRGRLDAKFYEVNDASFKELATYLAVHNLAGLLGLEVLDRPQDPNCGEYVLGIHGTVMIENKDIVSGSSYRKTQFVFDLNGNQEPDPVQPGTSDMETTYETHRVLVGPQYGQATIRDVVQGLKEAKVWPRDGISRQEKIDILT